MNVERASVEFHRIPCLYPGLGTFCAHSHTVRLDDPHTDGKEDT